MIRLRSQKLLSGVSALAMLATFGAVDPVLADTISGPGNVPAINTDDLADLGPVDINTNANVLTDGSGRSFYNPLGNILTGGAATALEIDDSVLQGSISNVGSITSTLDGINVDESIVNGGISNTGYISAGADGIEIDEGVFLGGINNSGDIFGGEQGIEIDDTTIFSGGITNSGTLSGGTGINIDNSVSFAGGINNSGTAAVIEGTSGIAIDIDADSFAGGITNAGLIEGQNGNTAINITADVFTGGINNTATGTIGVTSSGANAINIAGDLFQGGITNAGVIDADTSTAYGILISGNTFQGGINNSGQILSDSSSAISWTGSLFQGGIVNTGLIESDSGTGIDLSGTTFQGGITNSGTAAIIQASDDAINISATTFEGGITNSGLIESTSSGNAIDVNGSTFSGGIVNTGTLSSVGATQDAVTISASAFNGGITNSGAITGGNDGVSFSGASFNGGLNNQSGGSVVGALGHGVNIGGTSFAGGVTNAGLLQGLNPTGGAGVFFNGTSFQGGIQNTGSIVGADLGIDLQGSSFTGGITNSGLVTSGSGSEGISISTTTFTGGIYNTATGVIRSGLFSSDNALSLTGTTFEGGITNAGQIVSDSSSGIGVFVDATTFSGGINNTSTGLMQGANQGLFIDSDTFSGGLTNAGVIQATDTNVGVEINSTTFTGGVNNSGTIQGSDGEGLRINATTFEGGLENSGLIQGSTSAVNISVTNWTGGFNNTSTGVINALTSTGVNFSATNLTGGFTNAGTILGATSVGYGTGVNLSITNFSGDFVNSGLISGGAASGSGVSLSGALFDGDVTNSGTIIGTGGYDGLFLGHDLYTGNVANTATGKITGGTNGVLVADNVTIAGSFTNAGIIDPSFGLFVDGAIQGGIFNSGTILGTVAAIDLSIANGTDLLDPTIGHTITQTAGLIQGNSLADGTGTVEIALSLDNGLVDTFNGNGGVLDGDSDGGEGLDFFNVAGVFQYLRGTADDFAELNIDSGVGTFGAGGEFGVTFETLAFNINGGTAIVGDLSLIDVANDFTVNEGGTLGFFLTTDDGTHGLVQVGGDAFLAGPLGTSNTTLLAVLDPSTFAEATSDTYVYDDIITGTINNTFTEVTTSSLFWVADPTYNAGDVDLEINRVDFGDVLNQLGLIQSQNQQAIGDTLEEIFQDIQVNGPVGNEFDDLFAALFGTTDPEVILAMYDEINGSEHAQVQQSVLNASQIFNTIVGDQMDRTLLTIDGARFANLGTQRYASAAAVMASDASAGAVGGSHGLNRGASGMSLWARGFGQWTNTDSDPEASGYDQDSTGLAGGLEFALNNNASLGGAVVYSNTDVEFDSPGDAAEFDSWQVGLYGNYGFGHFYAGGSANYAWHDVSTVRTIQLPVPNAPFTALAGYDASAWSASGEVGGIWRLGRVNVQPSLGVSYTGADTDGFIETGDAGAYTLDVSSTDADSLAGILALRASGLWTMGQTRVVPDIKVGWRHEFNDDRQTFTALYLGDPTETPFTIVSSEVQQDAALVSAGLTFGLTNNLEIFGDVNGLYNSDSSSTNASGGVRLTW